MTHTLTLARSPLQAALPPIGSPASGQALEGGGRPSLTFETEVPLSFETSLSREATPARPRAAEPRGRARAEPRGEGSEEPMAQADLDGAAVRVQAHQRGRVVRRGLGPAAARPPAAGGSKHAAERFDGGREEADLDGADLQRDAIVEDDSRAHRAPQSRERSARAGHHRHDVFFCHSFLFPRPARSAGRPHW